jgi:hypothetical protein
VNYDYVQQAIVSNALSRRNNVYHTAMQTTVRGTEISKLVNLQSFFSVFLSFFFL